MNNRSAVDSPIAQTVDQVIACLLEADWLPGFADQLADPSTATHPEFNQSIAQQGIERLRMEGYAA